MLNLFSLVQDANINESSLISLILFRKLADLVLGARFIVKQAEEATFRKEKQDKSWWQHEHELAIVDGCFGLGQLRT